MARQRYHRRKRTLMAEINVVPYIDVMLVLLVIFMITAPLLTTGVEVDLPQTDAKTVQAENLDPIVLSVDSIGDWYLSLAEDPELPINREGTLRLVRDALGADPKRPVRVAADRSIDYGRVMEAMVALQVAGADKVQLMSGCLLYTSPSPRDRG